MGRIVTTLCGLLLLCPLSAFGGTAPGFTLSGLMRVLASVRTASASFTETKSLPLVTIGLQSRGTLAYMAPDYLRKTTTEPVPQQFVLRNGIARLTMSGRTKRFALDQAPQLAGLVEGVRATLAGDLPVLQHYYTLSLSGGARHWQLLLRPKAAALSKIMAWMSITGDGDKITEVDSADATGGEARMRVRETILHAR